MNDLEHSLQRSNAEVKLIVTDGVFSMDAEVAPLPELFLLAKKYGATLCLDDCHATGVIGKSGCGTEEYHDMIGSVDIITSTLSKGLGDACGGFVAGSKNLIENLRRRSRSYVFSTALPPSTVAGAMKALQLIKEDKSILTRLHKNAKFFRAGMQSAGFEVKGTDHPICPVMIRDDMLTWKVAEHLQENGVWVPWIIRPVSAEGEQKIRLIINSAHTAEEMKNVLKIFIEAKERFLSVTHR